jgi:peroxiredoxin
MIHRYVERHAIPYTILSDKGSKVAAQYFQVKHYISFGTPTVFLIDQNGKILYAHYADSLLEEPDNKIPLSLLTGISGG